MTMTSLIDFFTFYNENLSVKVGVDSFAKLLNQLIAANINIKLIPKRLK